MDVPLYTTHSATHFKLYQSRVLPRFHRSALCSKVREPGPIGCPTFSRSTTTLTATLKSLNSTAPFKHVLRRFQFPLRILPLQTHIFCSSERCVVPSSRQCHRARIRPIIVNCRVWYPPSIKNSLKLRRANR